MKTRTNGRMISQTSTVTTTCRSNESFMSLFNLQLANQKAMLKSGKYDDYKLPQTVNIPVDDICLFSYHIQHLQSEIGEVLEADKRWKNLRKSNFNRQQKIDEIADCFIVLMNIAMFSGVDSQEMLEAIASKIDIVSKRIAEEN